MTAPAERPRILVVALDGLRPDHLSPALTPNLLRLAEGGVRFRTARSVFPSETRVNQATLVTGRQPSGHGIVGNRFVDAGGSRLFADTTRDDVVAALAGAGRLLDAASLGEVLARHGLTLAVLGCGTAGGNRILHHAAPDDGSTVNVSAHGADRSATPQAAEALFQRVGRPPEKGVPDGARLAWLADAWIGDVAPRLDPDVGIVWFSEPGPSYHYPGLRRPEAAASSRVRAAWQSLSISTRSPATCRASVRSTATSSAI